ncbi:flagellar basal body-associated FliL family protein [Rhodoferax sp.]|uniref:flagellar basal body-associated FliL family protein n=1 Tax=Rhodoferax sp. TaxID=50421 RepID=UPI0025EB3C58|nr:flagellar basal body-associated FliL family protein [Rhodoferax sp.]
MSAPAAAEASAPPKAKGKKMLVIIMAVVLLLVLGGGGWFFFLRHPATEDGEDAAPASHSSAKPTTPPVFLPMDNMVVNLADAGGEKFAQVGITIGVVDQHTSDAVKANLPIIRSAVLLLISQRTSDELLTKEGKEKLAHEILREVSTPLGYEVDEPDDEEADAAPKKKSKKKHVAAASPIVSVLFSSFIIQ